MNTLLAHDLINYARSELPHIPRHHFYDASVAFYEGGDAVVTLRFKLFLDYQENVNPHDHYTNVNLILPYKHTSFHRFIPLEHINKRVIEIYRQNIYGTITLI